MVRRGGIMYQFLDEEHYNEDDDYEYDDEVDEEEYEREYCD